MYADDGTWASKHSLREKGQNAALDFMAVVKTTQGDHTIADGLAESAKQTAALDSTIKSTYQSVGKLAAVLQQVQDSNYALLDTLREADQTHKVITNVRAPPPTRIT